MFVCAGLQNKIDVHGLKMLAVIESGHIPRENTNHIPMQINAHAREKGRCANFLLVFSYFILYFGVVIGYPYEAVHETNNNIFYFVVCFAYAHACFCLHISSLVSEKTGIQQDRLVAPYDFFSLFIHLCMLYVYTLLYYIYQLKL